MNFFEDFLKKRRFFDGSMGTMLGEKLTPGELPEVLNIQNPSAVLEVHKAYAAAGCDILKTNTFGANRLKLARTEYSVGVIISAAVSLAKQAAGRARVALSVGPTGRLLSPFGDLDFEEAVSIFGEMVTAGADAGADLILIETMNDIYELKAAMIAAKQSSELPLIVTFSPDENGRLLTGGDIQTAVCVIEALGADALGINCGYGPAQVPPLVSQLAECSTLPIVLNPNAGLPTLKDGKTVFDLSAEEFALQMSALAENAAILGGCCGTTPAHIERMRAACEDIPLAPKAPKTGKKVDRICSFRKSVTLCEDTKIAELTATSDPDNLIDAAFDATRDGAEVLCIRNATVEAVTALQGVIDTPLVIKTSDKNAAEQILRIYNGVTKIYE